MSNSTPTLIVSRDELHGHLRGLNLGWCRGVTMHHTAFPDLAMRPEGLTKQHVKNLLHYYRNELHWSGCPHIFVDDTKAWILNPLDQPGVHARSFNHTHIGVEVLGNYDKEDPRNGRGFDCWSTAAWVVAEILARKGTSVETINGHRDDHKTAKSCPGKLVGMPWFRAMVAKEGARQDSGSLLTNDDMVESTEGSVRQLSEALDAIQWQLNKVRRLYDA